MISLGPCRGGDAVAGGERHREVGYNRAVLAASGATRQSHIGGLWILGGGHEEVRSG